MTERRCKVLDISHHNTVDSWAEMEEAGVVGVIHKATEGATYTDDMYLPRQVSEERAATNILWAAYHFLRPGDMIAQAQFFVHVTGVNPAMIYAADHEDPDVSLDDLKTFLAEVERLTGKPPIIYSGHVIKEQVGSKPDSVLASYPLWLAHYADPPSWPTHIWPEYWLWQYSDQETFPGMDGPVDKNHYAYSDARLIEEWLLGEEPVLPQGPTSPSYDAELVVTVIVPPGVRVEVIQQQSR